MASARSFWKIGLIAIIVILIFWVFSTYNALVTGRENLNNSWRQVETQYQRRFDLIPNLVSTVKGEANFEQETLTAVTEARTNWLNAGEAGDRGNQVEAAQQFDSALSRLLVTVESYPTLRATEAYEAFMVQLEGTENRIATARKDYNDEVRNYNLLVRRFPGNILAGMFGYVAEEGFRSDEGSEDAPEVNFD